MLRSCSLTGALQLSTEPAQARGGAQEPFPGSTFFAGAVLVCRAQWCCQWLLQGAEPSTTLLILFFMCSGVLHERPAAAS